MNVNNQPHEPMTRREREKAMHRQDIMDAAISVFSEKGFYASTLDEIAQRAEFSKGTLYLYFQNKEDILFSILLESLNSWHEMCIDIMSDNKPFQDELSTLLKETGKYIFENPKLFSLHNAQEAGLFKALSEENREMLLTLKKNTKEQLRIRVNRAVDQKEIRPVATEALIGMIHGSIGSLVFGHWGCKTTAELNKKIDVYIDMIFNGIALRKE